VEEHAEALVTWRSAAVLAVLLTILPVLAVFNFPYEGHLVTGARIGTVIWEGAILTVLLAQRHAPRLRTTRIAFVLTSVPLLPTFWFLAGERAAQGTPLELFVRENIVSLVYALATPPRAAASLIVIGAFTTESFLMLFRPHITGPEILFTRPWTNVVVSLAAVAIAIYRSNTRRAEVAMIVEFERAASVRHLARTYLAVRDLVNTPLQTLKVSLSVLGARCPGSANLIDRMERSLDRLNELNQVLVTETASLDLKPGAESFDPLHVIQTPATARGSG
jgi:hypothetical protein